MTQTLTNRLPRLIDVDHTDPLLKTFILFVQTADVVLKYADAKLYRKKRLSAIKYIVLQILAANGGTMTPSQIAEWTFRGRNNITTLIDRMKQDRLVRTDRKNKDKRVVSVTLTAKGREVLKQSTQVAREIVERVMLSIPEGDTVPFRKSLMLLRQNAYDNLIHLVERAQYQPE